MSEFFFDDSKNYVYDDEFGLRRSAYRPLVSPGKVTLTARIAGTASLGAEGHQQVKSSSGAPVQRKAMDHERFAPTRSGMSDWDVAFRPDLCETSHEEPETVPIQRNQPSAQGEGRPLPSSRGDANLPEDVSRQVETSFGTDLQPNAQTAAMQGIQGTPQPLPHLERIQEAFGSFDVSNVKSFVGGSGERACQNMGATAYTMGDSVVFETVPDLHTAAHEAAHVVQQRAGVQLKDGIGKTGDGYEQHADKVADAVVHRQPAAPLLQEFTGAQTATGAKYQGTRPKASVQRKEKPYKDVIDSQPDDDRDHFRIEASAPSTVALGTTVEYSAVQTAATIIDADSTYSFHWSCINAPASTGNDSTPNSTEDLSAVGRRWKLTAERPGTHIIRLKVLLNKKTTAELVYRQHVTETGQSPEHENIIRATEGLHADPCTKEWTTAELVKWIANPEENNVHDFKEQWIHGYRRIIQAAAAEYDLPMILVAGIAYNEVGGDPLWLDNLAYGVRKFDHAGDPLLEPLTVTKDPQLTSFGNVSIQVRRAAEALRLDPEKMSNQQESMIVDSLQDPKQNLFIAAKHLADLRDVDFEGKGAATMTEDDILITATRYNRGPDLSLEEIRKNTSNGRAVIKRAETLLQLLQEPAVPTNCQAEGQANTITLANGETIKQGVHAQETINRFNTLYERATENGADIPLRLGASNLFSMARV